MAGFPSFDKPFSFPGGLCAFAVKFAPCRGKSFGGVCAAYNLNAFDLTLLFAVHFDDCIEERIQ